MSEAGFNIACAAGPRNDTVGIGVVCFHRLDDVRVAVASIAKHGGGRYPTVLFDNSGDSVIGDWAEDQALPWLTCISSPNQGCWGARNRIAEHFAMLGCKHWIAQDMDVEWTGDIVPPMLAVFKRYPDTGVVTWPLATQSMGNHRYDATGACWPPECPGMCCMYSIEALTAGDCPDLIGWCPEFGLCWRGDTDYCYSVYSKGYQTRVVLAPDMVNHRHPHRGTAMLGSRLIPEQQKSEAAFRARSKRFRWPRV